MLHVLFHLDHFTSLAAGAAAHQCAARCLPAYDSVCTAAQSSLCCHQHLLTSGIVGKNYSVHLEVCVLLAVPDDQTMM
jgi:hypothetical protein